jgi:hypothetical protein
MKMRTKNSEELAIAENVTNITAHHRGNPDQ